MASLPYPRTPLSPRLPLSFFRFTLFFSLIHPISFLLHTPYFCHPHRPTRMLVSTDADARNDRCGCSYRPTRMTFVDVSQCQTFTFVLPNLYFRSAKLLLSCSQTFTFAVQNIPFYILHSLFLAISSPVFLDQRCFPVVCILWLQSLKTVSLAYNNIMCASTMRCFNCKQLLKQT